VYFNRSSGGLRKQYRKFETDYWSVSYREGLEWIVRERLAEVPPRPHRVTTCDYSGNERVQYYVEQWPDAPARVRITGGYQDADLFLSVRRYGCHRDKGRVLHVVRRQGVPLLYVHRVQSAR
ncbi:MAG TPA: hypothetical protein VJR89_02165, partial [Polyangiales bacterium]|nr:hypothetical protein [Polyangiales bacterium]